MSYKTYKFLDIAILTALAVIAEVAGIGAVKTFFEPGSPISFILSLALPVVMIIIIRWNYYGLIAALAIGITNHIVLGSSDLSHLVIYSIGNLGVAVVFLWLHYRSKEAIRSDWILTTLYYLTGYIGVIVCRSLIAMLFGNHLLNTMLNMFLQGEFLSIIIGFVVMMIARRQPNFMVDMKTYLLKFHTKDVNQDGL